MMEINSMCHVCFSSTDREDRETYRDSSHVLPCTEAQRGAPKRCRDPELMETLHMPRVPPQRPPPLTHTHTCRESHTYWGLGEIQKHAKQRKAEEKFTITFQSSKRLFKTIRKQRMPREPLPSLPSRRKSSSMHTVRHTPAMEYQLQGVKVKSLLLCYHESMIRSWLSVSLAHQ